MSVRSLCLMIGILGVNACASKQLTTNTLNIANSVEALYTHQALANLSKYIEEPFALPSQVDIAAGTIQTSNSVSPTISFPLSPSFTQAVAALTTKTATIAGAGLGIGASDAWQQNWNVAPITDANALRNLRALYRSVLYGGEILLKKEYKTSREYNGSNKLIDTPYETEYPQCVLCTVQKKVNEKLKTGWLYWTSDASSSTPERRPPPETPIVNLGSYGHHYLFMTKEDYINGYLADFTLFIMPNAEPPESSSKGGSSAAGGKSAGNGAATPRSGNARHNFQLLLPQQIIPSP